MKKVLSCAVIALMAGGVFAAESVPETEAKAEVKTDVKAVKKDRIEIMFVLDSTGSMSGLIDGAKKKIWSIANAAAMRKPVPEIRIGILSYRDKGDAYITKTFDLTGDLDKVFQDLQTIEASGGGDEPESVNQALHEAVAKTKWTEDPEVMKTVFLVGDCEPHMDYQDDVKYPDTCKLAAQKGIVINAILCGNNGNAEKYWLEISSKTDGYFAKIDQTGGVKSIATPFDKELAQLSSEITSTVIVYGSVSQQKQMERNIKAAASYNSFAVEKTAAVDSMEIAASRAALNSKFGRAVQGCGDIIADDADIAEIKESELPENMKNMSIDERKKYIAEQKAKRAVLNEKIAEVSAKRDKFIANEQARLVKEGKGDGFDMKVNDMLNAQAEKVFGK